MTPEPSSYHRHRFPAEIISHAVWLYHVFSLSLRDVELILAERGVVVTHESIRNWCQKFGAEFAKRLRRRRPRPGDTWHLDEVFIRIRGVLHYLWRAVDQHGVVLDILVQEKRDGAAAKRFFRRLLQWVAIQTEAPDHRRSAQLWRCTPCPAARCQTPDQPLFEQPGGEFASTDATAGAADATVQVTRPGAGLSLGARHHLRSLPATASSPQCCRLSACSDQSVSDLATGDVCPAGGIRLGTPASSAPTCSAIG